MCIRFSCHRAQNAHAQFSTWNETIKQWHFAALAKTHFHRICWLQISVLCKFMHIPAFVDDSLQWNVMTMPGEYFTYTSTNVRHKTINCHHRFIAFQRFFGLLLMKECSCFFFQSSSINTLRENPVVAIIKSQVNRKSLSLLYSHCSC